MPNSSQTSFSLLGLGAIGTQLAYYFHNARIPVQLLVKDKTQQALLTEQGLRITQKKQTQHIPAKGISFRQAVPTAFLWVTLKAQQIAPALQQIQSQLDPNCVIVLFNNGLGVQEELNKLQLTQPVVAVSHALAATLTAPFSITICGTSPLELGLLSGTITSQQQHRLCDTLSQLGLFANWHEAILPRLWLKFAVNCVINPITTLLQQPNGVLAQQNALVPCIQQLCQETVQVAAQLNIQLSEKELIQTVLHVAKNTQHNHSSMLQDYLNGKDSEIQYLNGYLVRLAQAHQCAAPTHQLLAALIQTLEEKKRS